MSFHGECKLHKQDPEWHKATALWMIWLLRRGFLKIWMVDGRPIGCCCWRPVGDFYPGIWMFEHLFDYDLAGENIWVDYLWIPGRFDLVIRWLDSTHKKSGGWQRRDNFSVHIVPIRKLKLLSFALRPNEIIV
jgi:hypothetical protein